MTDGPRGRGAQVLGPDGDGRIPLERGAVGFAGEGDNVDIATASHTTNGPPILAPVVPSRGLAGHLDRMGRWVATTTQDPGRRHCSSGTYGFTAEK